MIIRKKDYLKLWTDRAKSELNADHYKDKWCEARAAIFSLKEKIKELQTTIVELEEIPSIQLFQYDIIYTNSYISSTPAPRRVCSGYIAAKDEDTAERDLLYGNLFSPDTNIIDIKLKKCIKNFQQTSDSPHEPYEFIVEEDDF